MPNHSTFFEKTEALLVSPQFQQLEAALSQKGLFAIIGDEAKEKIHQHILAFSLHPNQSHQLGDFCLKRLLVLAARKRVERANPPTLWNPNGTGNFKSPDLTQAEFLRIIADHHDFQWSTEKQISEKKRLDIFGNIPFKFGESDNKKDLSIIIETKVKHRVTKRQLDTYTKWMTDNDITTGYRLPILVTTQNANEEVIAEHSPLWVQCTWQEIHDTIVVPALNNPNLSEVGRGYLRDWNKALTEIGVKTQEIADLVDAIGETFTGTLDQLFSALNHQDLSDRVPHLATLVNLNVVPVGTKVSFLRNNRAQTIADQGFHPDTGIVTASGEISVNGDLHSRLVDALREATGVNGDPRKRIYLCMGEDHPSETPNRNPTRVS